MPTYPDIARSPFIRRAGTAVAVAAGTWAIAGSIENQNQPQNVHHEKVAALAQPLAHITMMPIRPSVETSTPVVRDRTFHVAPTELPVEPTQSPHRKKHHRLKSHHAAPKLKPIPYVAKKFDGCDIPSKPAHAATDTGDHPPVIYSLVGKNNEQKIFNYFLQIHLLNPVGASGIGGNAWQESHYSPLNPGGITTEGGELWDHEEMLANAEGRSPDDLYVQLQDICQELTDGPYAYGNYKYVLENVRRAATPEDAAIQFMGPTPLSNGGVTDGFENPGIPAESVRTSTARAIYDELHHDSVAQVRKH